MHDAVAKNRRMTKGSCMWTMAWYAAHCLWQFIVGGSPLLMVGPLFVVVHCCGSPPLFVDHKGLKHVDYGLVCRPVAAVGPLPTRCSWERGLGVKATVLRPGM